VDVLAAAVLLVARFFRWQGMATVIGPVIQIERLVLFCANLLFLFLSLAAVGLAIWPKTIHNDRV